VLAMVGGVNFQQSQFNRATQAYRQPGSTFKIFTYATALEQGISPGTTYSCAPLDWQGQSFEGCRSGAGSLDMYGGLAESENVVALRIAQQVGLNSVIQTARRMGISSKLEAVPGMVLGQNEVNLLELTGAYSVLANQGVRHSPHLINRILDSSDCKNLNDHRTCRVIYDAQQDAAANQTVLPPQIAETMTSLLQGVVQSGTGRGAALGLGEAGKTGTTNDYVDLWFVGYIPSRSLTTGIWFGNDDNSPTSGTSGDAAQLWGDYMRRIVR
jgi:membrane peptidoglycan carboxypeptidase